jgi:RNA polymerase sigma-70 factor, ECF subfamily
MEARKMKVFKKKIQRSLGQNPYLRPLNTPNTKPNKELNADKHKELVSALSSGDISAFAPIYESYSPMVYGLVLKIVNDPKEAENLLQEVFIKVWKKIDTYDPDKGSFATWIINIARNTGIDFTKTSYFKRKNKNQNDDLLVLKEDDHPLIYPKTDTIGLRKIVESLSPPSRQVIEMMYYKGYTQQEISDVLEIPIGTIKTRSRMAIKELRTYYGNINF